MRRIVAHVVALTLVLPLVLSAGTPSLADGDVEQRIAEFWKRIDAMRSSDLLSAADLGQWALNVIERDPGARIVVTDFRASTAGMQAGIERAGRVGALAPATPAVEKRIAEFWQRIDAMQPGGYLSAADLGQWALNVTERDPGARIIVSDFRAATAGMQSAIDRAGKAPVSSLPPTTSWVKTGGFPTAGVHSGVAVDPTRAGYVSVFVENVGVVWTRDNGTSWRNIWCVNPHAQYSVKLDPVSPDYVHISSGGLICVADLARGTKVRELDLGGPANGSLVPYAGRMYAATDQGIFWTTDQWLTKQQLLTSGAPTAMAAIAFDPTDPRTIYAGTRVAPGGSTKVAESGVYKSVDGGGSWSQTALNEDIRALAADPHGSGAIYALTFGSAVYKSSDAGSTWTSVSLAGRSNGATALFMSPTTPGLVYVGTRDVGVFRSADGGVTWSNIRLSTVAAGPSPYPANYRDYVTSFASSAADPGKVYVSTADGLFSLSGDQPSFVRIQLPNGPSGLDAWEAQGWSDIAAASSDPAVVYAVDRCGQDAYRSRDGGVTWEPIGPAGSGIDYIPDGNRVKDPREQYPSTSSHTYGMRVAVDPLDSSRVWLAANAGLFSSSDGGTTWSRRSFKEPLGSYAGCVRCYLDSGHMHALAAGPAGSRTLYAGLTAESAYAGRNTTDGPGGYVFKSTDGGATWTDSSRGIPAPVSTSMYVMAVSRADPNVVYFGTNRWDWGIRTAPVSIGVYRTADAGANWTAAGLKDHDIEALAIDPVDPSVVYAGTRQGLFKSTNGGAAWTLLRGASPGTGAATGTHAVAVHPTDPSIVLAGFMGQGLYLSRDAGRTWSVLNASLKDVIAISISGRIVYAATKYNGIYRGPLP